MSLSEISTRSLLTAIDSALYPLGVTLLGSALKERSILRSSRLPLNAILIKAVCLVSLMSGSLTISGCFSSILLTLFTSLRSM